MPTTVTRPRRLNLKPGPIRITAQGHQDLTEFDDYTVRPISGRAGWVEPSPVPLQGKGGLEVWGEVTLRNGDTVIRARNKITGQGLRHLVNLGASAMTWGTNAGNYHPFDTNDLAKSYIRVGVGAGATIDTTTALVSATATNPSSTLFVMDSPSAGVYRAKFTATWNSGVLAAVTVTEIGIFGWLATTLGIAPVGGTGQVATNTTALALFARLSTADGEFSAFTVNTAVPLTIEYRIVYTFT